MQKLLKEYLNEANKRHKKNRRIGIAVMLLVLLVAGSVAGVLTQYGIAMTGSPQCGLEEHQHGESCYEDVLICGLEESEGHTHTDACLSPAELTCGLEESEGHVHTDECKGDPELTCELEEGEDHTHGDECYTQPEGYICGQEESEGHTHGDECYTRPEGYICGQEEGEGHTHGDECYKEQLTCNKEEHTHTDVCYIDSNADVEDPASWDAQYAAVQWTGNWGEDLVTAARMQVGYKESQNNYTVADSGVHKGYSRYGHFSGNMYQDWDAVFVNFCIHYAGLDASGWFPKEADSAKWQEEFGKIREENAAYLTAPTGYEPKAGDIVFLQKENEETAVQIAIVTSYDGVTGALTAIEGNSGNEVKENSYQATESYIAGYLKISELEAACKNEEGQTESDLDTDGSDTEQNVFSVGTGETADAGFLPIGDQENGARGIELTLLYSTGETHAQKPEGEAEYPYRTMYGYFQLMPVNLGGKAENKDFTVSLYFPKEYIEPGEIDISEFNQGLAKHEISSVEAVTIENQEYYKISVKFFDYIPSGAVQYPFSMRFLNNTVPEDYELKIFGTVEADGVSGQTAESIYHPKYDKPRITKYVNSNVYDNMKDDGTRVSAEVKGGVLTGGDYVSFWYRLNEEPWYFREYETIVLTDTLPEYETANGTRTAVFDQAQNPGWVLSADGKTVSRIFKPAKHSDEIWNTDSDLINQIKGAELKLRFPDCLIEEMGEDGFLFVDLKNHIDAECTPYQPSDAESSFTIGDDIIFELTNQPSANGNFGKYNTADTIMDIEVMRSGKYRWSIIFDNPNTESFQNVTIEDYELDERLKIQEIYISVKSFSDTFVTDNIDRVEAYTYDGETVIYKAEDFGKIRYDYDDGLKFRQELKFDEGKEIKGFQVFMKDSYQMKTGDNITIWPFSTFRKPEEKHFEKDDAKNLYRNKALATYWAGTAKHFLYSENQFKLIESYENIWLQKTLNSCDNMEYPKVDSDGSIKYSIGYCYMYIHGTLDGGKTYDDMQIVDLLPEALELPEGKVSYGTGGKYVERTEFVNNYHNSGRTAVIFHMNVDAIRPVLGAAKDGEVPNILFTFKVQPKVDAPAGKFTNEAYLFSEDFYAPPEDHEYTQDIYDMDSDGNREEKIRYSQAGGGIKSPTAIYSEKYIAPKGVDSWRKSSLRLGVGDEFRYKLRVNNADSTVHSDLVVYDVLPRIGDKSISGQDSRDSEFAVELSGAITPPDGYQVSYTESEDVYSRSMEDILNDESLAWIQEPSAFSNITAFKIEAVDGTTLPGGQYIDFIIPVKTEASLSEGSRSILEGKTSTDRESGTSVCLEATNSFGYRTNHFRNGNLESNYVKAEIDFAGFVIKKVEDLENKALEGAVFQLEKTNLKPGEEPVSITSKESGKDGIICFENLTEGTYELREIKAPSGYSILTEPLTVTIQLDRMTMEYKITIPENEHAGNNEDPFLIANHMGYELPSTGGSGIYWYSIGGILLMMAGALILYKIKCKEVLGS